MINYIFTIIKSNNINVLAFKWLIIIGIICLLFLLLQKFDNKSENQEGFTQIEPFVFKRNDDVYDDFYSLIYDDIHKPSLRTDFELEYIINMTEPTTRNSVFLDIGSGTGNTVNELQEAGYQAYGIDKSHAMIDIAEQKFPDIQCKCGDATEPMAFENSTFTHIICNYFTIYQIKEKRTLFTNCNHWLMPNGYLIIHLADRNKFDTITPVGKTALPTNPNRYISSRITDTIVDFGGFEYKSSYQFNKESENIVSFVEKFQDKETKHVRENEQILYFEPIEVILQMARECRFSLKSKIDMKKNIDDENQYIYILEKI